MELSFDRDSCFDVHFTTICRLLLLQVYQCVIVYDIYTHLHLFLNVERNGYFYLIYTCTLEFAISFYLAHMYTVYG